MFAVIRTSLYNPSTTFAGFFSRAYIQENICLSKEFNEFNLGKDLAIIKLSNDLEFNQMVQPACLPTDEVDKNIQAHVIGMGVTYKSDSELIKPQKLQVLPVKQTVCDSLYHNDYQICFRQNKDDQVGDSCIGKYWLHIFQC